MKPTNLLIIGLLIGVIFMFMYSTHQSKKDNIRFNEVTEQLELKDETIIKHSAMVAKVEYDRQIIVNTLNDKVEANKALRIELEKKPKIKIRYKDRIVEVIKFETLPDCQISLNLCLEKSKMLEFDVTKYININNELDKENAELDHELSGKMILLESERMEYKRIKRKNNLEKIGLAVVALILVVAK